MVEEGRRDAEGKIREIPSVRRHQCWLSDIGAHMWTEERLLGAKGAPSVNSEHGNGTSVL